MNSAQVSGRGKLLTLEAESPNSAPRILYLVTRSERGGAQMHLLDLALAMREKFEVHIAAGEEGFLTESCREHGIPVYVADCLEREIRPMKDVKALVELTRLIRSVQPDLVHAHTFKAGFLGRFAAKVLKIPAVYTVHMWPFGRAVPLSWRLVAPVCERRAANWCDKIITVSNLGARDAKMFRIGKPGQVVAILNGIGDHPARARLDRGGQLTFTMVARFTEFKDHNLLVRAFARIPGDSRLRLVGDGAPLATVRKLATDLGISDRVEFMGSRADVPEILADSNVFVLASKTETLPISILEAMRAGLPVIASDVGGVAEEVVDGQTGILVPPGSEEKMTAALGRLLADKPLRIEMGQRGRTRFEEMFRANTMMKRTAEVYAEVLQARIMAL